MTATPVAPIAADAREKCSVAVGAVSCATPPRWQVGPKHQACDAHLVRVLRVVNRPLNAKAGRAS